MSFDIFTACAQLVEKGDPDRFRATMAAPLAVRKILFPLYAFNLEVARAPWLTNEEMIAEMRLQWWRDALDEIATGKTPRRHEVVTPLAEILDPPAATLLDDLVLARRWDIYKDPFEDTQAFVRHIDQTSGTLLWVAARALGTTDEQMIRNAGFAQGLANWFRAIPALEEAGRLPLPDGRPQAIKDLATEGLARLKAARAERKSLPKSATPVMFALWETPALLRRAAADPARVAQGALGLSPLNSRLRLIRCATTGHW